MFANYSLFCINYKNIISTLYLFFGFASGIIGLILSVFIRLELGYVGNMYFAGNYQLYNVVVTTHDFIN